MSDFSQINPEKQKQSGKPENFTGKGTFLNMLPMRVQLLKRLVLLKRSLVLCAGTIGNIP